MVVTQPLGEAPKVMPEQSLPNVTQAGPSPSDSGKEVNVDMEPGKLALHYHSGYSNSVASCTPDFTSPQVTLLNVNGVRLATQQKYLNGTRAHPCSPPLLTFDTKVQSTPLSVTQASTLEGCIRSDCCTLDEGYGEESDRPLDYFNCCEQRLEYSDCCGLEEDCENVPEECLEYSNCCGLGEDCGSVPEKCFDCSDCCVDESEGFLDCSSCCLLEEDCERAKMEGFFQKSDNYTIEGTYYPCPQGLADKDCFHAIEGQLCLGLNGPDLLPAVPEGFDNQQTTATSSLNNNGFGTLDLPSAVFESFDSRDAAATSSGTSYDFPVGLENPFRNYLDLPLHQCQIGLCSHAYADKADLHAHITKNHKADVRNWVACPWVGCVGTKATSDKGRMYHLAGHSGHLPFPCIACGDTAFRSRQELRDHTNAVHRPEDAPKPRLCHVLINPSTKMAVPVGTPGAVQCQKRFVDASGVSRHRKTHYSKARKCPYCEAAQVDRGGESIRSDRIKRHVMMSENAKGVWSVTCPGLRKMMGGAAGFTASNHVVDPLTSNVLIEGTVWKPWGTYLLPLDWDLWTPILERAGRTPHW